MHRMMWSQRRRRTPARGEEPQKADRARCDQICNTGINRRMARTTESTDTDPEVIDGSIQSSPPRH
jgi:hypothetical protein